MYGVKLNAQIRLGKHLFVGNCKKIKVSLSFSLFLAVLEK